MSSQITDPAFIWGETRGPEDLWKSLSMEIILCFYEIHIIGKTWECYLVVDRFVIPRMGCCLLVCFNDLFLLFYILGFFLFLLFFFGFSFSFFFSNYCKFLLGCTFHEIKFGKFFLLLKTRDGTLAPQP